MSSIAVLIDLIGRDGASPALLKMGASADKAAASVAKAETGILGFSKKATAALGAVAAVDVAGHLVKDAAQFQKSMLLIQTQAGASATEVKKMSAAILGMAGSVGTSPDKLATSLYHIESVGLRGAKALGVLKIAAEGAKVGNADLEETTNALTSTVASGIGGVKNMGQAMGELTAIVGSGDMKMQDLNEALGSGLLVTMKTFGVNLAQTGAALATFGDNNIRGANAATSLIQAVRAMSAPMKGGLAALDAIGIGPQTLSKDLQSGGLTKALDDLSNHMKTAGDTGAKAGAFITEAFGKRAGTGLGVLVDQLQRFHVKLTDIQSAGQRFSSEWAATTKTASFEFDSIRSSLDAVGISIGTKLLPMVQAGMTGLIDAAHAIASISPEIKVIGGTVAAMWLAFKGYEIISAAIVAIRAFAASAVANFNGALTATRTWGAGVSGVLNGTASESALTARIMQAEFAQVEAAAMQEAATIARAAAIEATAYADKIAAAKSATDAQVTAAVEASAAANAAAVAAAGAATETVAAADIAAAGVVAAGDEAAIGWAAVAGPIGLVAVGILAVVSLFHKSASASKEATDAAKAYSDALSAGGKSDLVDTITKQLSNNDLPAELKKINDGLGRTAFTGKQFVDAISAGNPALSTLRDRLEAVVKSGTRMATTGTGRGGAFAQLTPAAKAASEALAHLNTQFDVLTKTAAKDLLNTKTFAGAAGAIQKTTTATQLGSKAAEQYATMSGLVVDKNGIVADSQDHVNAAVDGVAQAYNTATQSGDGYLAALDTFSKSSGTAADRAALIGATLKANAGDALSYAAAMNSAATANQQLSADVTSAAKGVGKSGESTRSFLDSIIKLKTGTIDFGKAAAGPLISDLQGIQTAAINAAEATYQHNKMLEGGKAAADDAVNGYKGIETSLEGQLSKLGLTSKQAQNLTQKYLGVPSKVKTLIEQEGANPVVDVLNKIGAMLARLTGQPWTTTMDGNTAPLTAKINDAQAYINRLKQNRVPGIQVGTDEYYRQLAAANARLNALKQGRVPAVDVDTVPAMTKLRELLAAIPKGTFTYTVAQMNARNADHAAGGYIRGPGSGTSDSIPANLSNGEFVVKASQTAKHLGLLNAINSGARGFAAGGLVSNYSAVASALKALGATNAGIAGFLASTKIESGGSTTAHNSGENAWGLQQWEGGRLTQLKALAARMGKSFTSQAAQVAMITHELLTGYSSTLKVLRSATDPRKAAAYVDAHYEASSGSARKAREDAAASFYKQLASGKISSSAVAGKAVGVVSTSAITSALFGSGGSFATRLISSVSNSLKGIVEKSGSAVAARAAVISHSTSVVNTAISKGIKPDLAEPDLIAALPNQILHAIGTEKQAEIAQKNYAALTANVTQLKNAVAQASAVTRNDVNAARAHATALSNEAHNAMQAASAMSGKTAADKANKAAAEAHAKALENQARAASQTATAMSRASSTGKANLEAELKAAQTVAAQAKAAYGTISQAAKDAAAAAAATAKTLVDDVKSDADALTSTIHDFTSSMSQSLTAGTDLSSIIQTLTGDNGGSPPAFDQVAASLQTAATAAQQFGSDLNAVAGAGGSQALVQQIAALGATTGDAFAKSLLSSGAAKSMSDTIASIQTVADTASAGLATSFFGSGANTMIQFIKGLQSQFPALTAALQAIMDSVAAAAGVDASKVKPPKVTTPAAPVKKYAMGTMWHPGGWALVGDAGPELLKLPTGSQVMNNRDMNRMKYPHAAVDTSGIERRLDLLARRLESTQRTIAATPEQTGQHVADASVNGYRVAGAADRRQALRAGRRAAR